MQTADILGLTEIIRDLKAVQSQRECGTAPGTAEIALRLGLIETEMTAFLDVDGVQSELFAERADLSDLRTSLQARRDHTVGYLNAASLIAGSGVGIAVNATQLRSSSSIPGDYLGVGSGAASTLLSVLAVRKMRGPRQSVGAAPNMLAPLFDRTPVLNTYYPPAVMKYLDSVPPSEDPGRGTRLEQMRAAWVSQGRIGSSGSEKDREKVGMLTSSLNEKVKLSIDDLSDRMAMLDDVSGRVSLMKRDLATLMRGYAGGMNRCGR